MGKPLLLSPGKKPWCLYGWSVDSIIGFGILLILLNGLTTTLQIVLPHRYLAHRLTGITLDVLTRNINLSALYTASAILPLLIFLFIRWGRAKRHPKAQKEWKKPHRRLLLLLLASGAAGILLFKAVPLSWPPWVKLMPLVAWYLLVAGLIYSLNTHSFGNRRWINRMILLVLSCLLLVLHILLMEGMAILEVPVSHYRHLIHSLAYLADFMIILVFLTLAGGIGPADRWHGLPRLLLLLVILFFFNRWVFELVPQVSGKISLPVVRDVLTLQVMGLAVIGWLLWQQRSRFLRRRHPGKKMMIGFAVLLAGLNGWHFLSIQPGRRNGQPNVVLAVVECLRADHLGATGGSPSFTPFLDRQAREGWIFERACSAAPWTRPSVASLMTSLYPNVHNTTGLTTSLANRALCMPEVFRDAGYRTWFFNGGNPHLQPSVNLAQGTEFYRDFDDPDGGLLLESFRSRLERYGEDKFFAYLHFMDTHLPYHGDQSGGFQLPLECDPIRALTARGELTRSQRGYLTGWYGRQVRYVDWILQQLSELLAERHLLTDTLVVVTGDHGEEFWDHGNFEHGHSLYQELLHVPLLIWGKDLKTRRFTALVSLLDIAPTLYDLCGIRIHRFEGQGISRVPGRPDPTPGRGLYATGTHYGDEKYCIVRDGWKLILNTGREKGKVPLVGERNSSPLELYHLNTDPEERHNRLNQLRDEPPFPALYRDLLKFSTTSRGWKTGRISLDEKTRRKLKSLGYLE